jgi:pyruvate carboxylase
VRRLYAPFESGLLAPTGRVYRHEIPGGQLSNLRQQAIALGLGEKFEQIEDMYAAANDILGNVVKVTPSSKVVGDLALHLVAVGADPDEFAADPTSFDIPDSVIGFLSGEIGDPPGGWPEPFRTKALEGRSSKTRVSELTDEESAALASDDTAERRSTLNRLLFPEPTDDYEKSRAEHGDLSALPTDAFWYGLRPDEETEVELAEGTLHLFGVEAIGEPDERGMRNVLGTINGQLRPTEVRDRSVEAKVASAEKADSSDPKQVAVPFAGVVSPLVEEGDKVESGQAVATIEAMKMEASITAPSGGTVKRIAIAETRQAEGGDLLLVLD